MKTHAAIRPKTFHPIYLKYINFLIKRCGRTVTKIYTHYTFGQEPFKKDFIIMNHVLRQNAKNNVEKDFYKLLNNSNFGYDFRNNIDNCFLELCSKVQ